jgi:hypothetical protein
LSDELLSWEGANLPEESTTDGVARPQIGVIAKVSLEFEKGTLVSLPRFIDAAVVSLLEIVLYTHIRPTTELCTATRTDYPIGNVVPHSFRNAILIK